VIGRRVWALTDFKLKTQNAKLKTKSPKIFNFKFFIFTLSFFFIFTLSFLRKQESIIIVLSFRSRVNRGMTLLLKCGCCRIFNFIVIIASWLGSRNSNTVTNIGVFVADRAIGSTVTSSSAHNRCFGF